MDNDPPRVGDSVASVLARIAPVLALKSAAPNASPNSKLLSTAKQEQAWDAMVSADPELLAQFCDPCEEEDVVVQTDTHDQAEGEGRAQPVEGLELP